MKQFLFIALFATVSPNLFCQQVNWNEVSSNLTNQLKQQNADREAQRQYYDNVTREVKNSIVTAIVIQDDPNMNSLILKIQRDAATAIDVYYRNLTSGVMEPNIYESKIRSIQMEAMTTYQTLLSISTFVSSLSKSFDEDPNQASDLELIYQRTLDAVSSEGFWSGPFQFKLNGMRYNGRNDNAALYDFITSSCMGSYELYVEEWNREEKAKREAEKREAERKRKAAELAEKERAAEDLEWRLVHQITSQRRSDLLNNMDSDESLRFLRLEFKYIIKLNKDWNAFKRSLKSMYPNRRISQSQFERFNTTDSFNRQIIYGVIEHLNSLQ